MARFRLVSSLILLSIAMSAVPVAESNSRYRYQEDEIKHEGAKQEVVESDRHKPAERHPAGVRVTEKYPSPNTAPAGHHGDRPEESRGFRSHSSSQHDGSSTNRYRPAEENVIHGTDVDGSSRRRPHRPEYSRDHLSRRPHYAVDYGKNYGYNKDHHHHDGGYYQHDQQQPPVYDLHTDDCDDHRHRRPQPNSGYYDDTDLYNSREPYWYAAYPPQWNYDGDDYRQYGRWPVKKHYRFRFIDNPPTDKGRTIGEGSSFYLGSDAMLQCKFPEDYKLVSNIEWRRLDAPSDWLKERYATLERQEKQRARLYIRHFDWRDFGHYQCVANVEGAFGKQSSKVMIDVVFTPDNADKYEPNPSDPDDEVLFPQPHNFPHSSSGSAGLPGLGDLGNLALPGILELSSNGLNAGPNSLPSSDGPFADFPDYNLANVKSGRFPLVSGLDFGSATGKGLLSSDSSGPGDNNPRGSADGTGYKIHAENHHNDKIYESFPLSPNPAASIDGYDESRRVPGSQELELIDVQSIGDHIYDTDIQRRARQRLLERVGQKKKEAAASSGRQAKLLDDGTAVETATESQPSATSVSTGDPDVESIDVTGRANGSKSLWDSAPSPARLVAVDEQDAASSVEDELPSMTKAEADSLLHESTPSHQKHDDEQQAPSNGTISSPDKTNANETTTSEQSVATIVALKNSTSTVTVL